EHRGRVLTGRPWIALRSLCPLRTGAARWPRVALRSRQPRDPLRSLLTRLRQHVPGLARTGLVAKIVVDQRNEARAVEAHGVVLVVTSVRTPRPSPGDPLVSLITLLAVIAFVALVALVPSRPLGSLRADGPLRALIALRPLRSDGPTRSRIALRALRTHGADNIPAHARFIAPTALIGPHDSDLVFVNAGLDHGGPGRQLNERQHPPRARPR